MGCLKQSCPLLALTLKKCVDLKEVQGDRVKRYKGPADSARLELLCRAARTALLVVAAVAISTCPRSAGAQPGTSGQLEKVEIDAAAPTTPFPHFWEQMFGSGHASLALREAYRDDIRAVKQVADFRYVRAHGILDDENGVYTEDQHGNPVYNFAYVDQIYDGLLKNGVRPVVEIGFMPRKLAFNPDLLHSFWYKPNISPPKSYELWDAFITRFCQHLVERYGVDEAAAWYFEVWNEPNIDFWGGWPTQRSYFELYDHTARAVKKANARLRVGGPATAAASWIPEFLAFTEKKNSPVDFISTHGYGDDSVQDFFGTDEDIPMDDRVGRAVEKVRKQINASYLPTLPLLWTEWNVPGRDGSRDTTYVGPALANTVRECDGNVDMLSFWTFSDIFEEGGPAPRAFIGMFGLRAMGGINKPSYYAYGLLHQLGNQRLSNASRNVIVTKQADGGLVVAAWNVVDPGQTGPTRTMELVFRGVPGSAGATIQRIDGSHGNVLKFYEAMGKPEVPTPTQVDQLNRSSALGVPEQLALKDGAMTLELEPNALVLVKVSAQKKAR
jgi:xylan 1,4-beta-xylosidase